MWYGRQVQVLFRNSICILEEKKKTIQADMVLLISLKVGLGSNCPSVSTTGVGNC